MNAPAPRILPIRPSPLPGEPLDSWLDAYAARLGGVARDLLAAAGLPAQPGEGTRRPEPPDYTAFLLDHEAEHLAAATGIPAPRLHAMTLRLFDGHAVSLDLERRLSPRVPVWGRGAGSRYCSPCLAGRGGRWVLRWRLPWVFACTRHRIVLADRCPGCGQQPRAPGHAPFVTTCPPGTCGAGTARREYCRSALTTAPAPALAAGHPLLAAQSWLDTLLDRVEAGRTDGHPPPRDTFGDLHALACWALRRAEPGDADALGGEGVQHAWHTAVQAGLPGGHADTFPPVDAAVAGVAVTRAIAVLTGDADTAVAALRTLVRREPARCRGIAPDSLHHLWDRTSPRLRQLVWHARDPELTPIDRLRYRTCTPAPRAPADHIGDRARHLPQLLWPGWTARLLPPSGVSGDAFRPAAAAAILLPGNPSRRINDATELLQPGRHLNVRYVLYRLTVGGHQGILPALCALADYLDHHGAPIDYARRRALATTDLLPEAAWHDMCRRTDAPPGSPRQLRTARRYLYQRIIGNDLRHAPAPFAFHPARPGERTFVRNLPLELPAPLHHALDDHAAAYLADKGIDEPLTWEPPADCLRGIALPGGEPTDLDAAAPHPPRDDSPLSGEASGDVLTATEEIGALSGDRVATAVAVGRIAHLRRD